MLTHYACKILNIHHDYTTVPLKTEYNSVSNYTNNTVKQDDSNYISCCGQDVFQGGNLNG